MYIIYIFRTIVLIFVAMFILAPCDFWLFPKLRGCRYETIEEMKEAVTKLIDTLTQEDFHGAFQKLLEQYNMCHVYHNVPAVERSGLFHVSGMSILALYFAHYHCIKKQTCNDNSKIAI